MIVKVEKIENNVVKLEIELEENEFNEGLSVAFQKSAKKFNVPGFRKGKAPRHIVERYYGVEILFDEAAKYLCPKHYELAIKEHDIRPVETADMEVVKMAKGEPFVFTAQVTVRPEVTLGEYKGLEVKYDNVLITDDDVEQELKRVASRNYRLVPVKDRAARMGDTVNIDFQGFVDGESFDGGEAEDFSLVIGSRKMVEGFEEQIVGASVGEEIEVNVTFPEDYPEGLKNKIALFKVRVNEIKTKEIPEIDDEFAQDVSEFDTLDEYKADIRAKITEHKDKEAKQNYENDVIKAVTANAEVDIPDVMVKSQYDYNHENLETTLKYQGLDLEKYLTYSGMSRENFEKTMNDRARNEVLTQLVISKVSAVEGIEANDKDIEKTLTDKAKEAKKDLDEYRKQLSFDMLEHIKDGVKIEKTIEFLVSNSVKI